ncbi:hypothetical protein Q7I19_06490 [Aeromonas veronii]|nr:hypothetical protein [Aeromonas veronii]MCR3967158.1 hypothetical protein [Aeromonas veronii]MCR3979705.1 hypothetical protein [Aeromonas veronii]
MFLLSVRQIDAEQRRSDGHHGGKAPVVEGDGGIAQPAHGIDHQTHHHLAQNGGHSGDGDPYSWNGRDHHHHVDNAEQGTGQLPLRHAEQGRLIGRLKEEDQQGGHHSAHGEGEQRTLHHSNPRSQLTIDRRLGAERHAGDDGQHDNQHHQFAPR